MNNASDSAEDTPSMKSSTDMAALPSSVGSLNSDDMKDEAVVTSPAESPSDDGFVHIPSDLSQKGSAMKALSSVLNPEQDQSSIDGDWVALSSPALKVHALGESISPSDSSTEHSAHAAAEDNADSKIFSFDNLRITSTDPAPGVDPTRRESYLSEAEFQQLFGMDKAQFYKLPKWKQSQRKLDLDLF